MAFIFRYSDKRVADEEKIPGFATLFKRADDRDRYFGWFPVSGVGSEKAWIEYFNRIREERFANVRKIRNEKAFYRFLRASLVENYEPDSKTEYFFSIPRGFTKSMAMSLENDFDGGILNTLRGKKLRFTKIRKYTEGIGLCLLEPM